RYYVASPTVLSGAGSPDLRRPCPLRTGPAQSVVQAPSRRGKFAYAASSFGTSLASFGASLARLTVRLVTQCHLLAAARSTSMADTDEGEGVPICHSARIVPAWWSNRGVVVVPRCR